MAVSGYRSCPNSVMDPAPKSSLGLSLKSSFLWWEQSKGGGRENCNYYVFLINPKINNAGIKGDPSREVVLLSNELNMMPYKHLMARPEKVTGTGEPYPRASAGSEILTKVIGCLPGCLGAAWSSVPHPPHPPAQTPIPLGGQESSPCLQISKQRI